jgi:ankyrin repeat protein
MKKSIFLILFFLTLSCDIKSNSTPRIYNPDIFINTIAKDLIFAIEVDNYNEIKKIISQNPKVMNVQDPYYGITPLIWAVGTEKYEGTKALLDCGADPNLISNLGTTALFQSVSFSWFNKKSNNDTKILKLLLQYNADPNICYCSPKVNDKTDIIECGTSPLIHSVNFELEKVKILINAGANINYKTKTGITAAIEALTQEEIDNAHYLIVHQNALVNEPYYHYSFNEADTIEYSKPHYPVDLLLDLVYDLDSKEYKKKQEIVKEFKRQGVDYDSRKPNIRKNILRYIQENYKDNWEEYIQKY